MSVVPYRFLVRMMHFCPFVADMPGDGEETLVELPETARLDPFAEIDEAPRFADVRLGWNDTGLGLTVEVRGKDEYPTGDINFPRHADGVTLWIDTRGDRSSHRATRTCHQFHFLTAGGGSEKDEPAFLQAKINRALVDAPLAAAGDVPFRCERIKGGYRIEAFLSGNVLSGWDPADNPRLGVYYAVRDAEKGEQTPGVGSDFPYADDPSLWATLELKRE